MSHGDVNPTEGQVGLAPELAYKIRSTFPMIPDERVEILIRKMEVENQRYTDILNAQVDRENEADDSIPEGEE